MQEGSAATGLRTASGLALLAYLGVAYWMRRHPSAMPYAQRLFTELPHPLISRDRLRRILAPQPGEDVLEIGPGTGYYTLDLARWVAPVAVEILDVRQEFLDHVMRRAAATGVENVRASGGDAGVLPFEERRFDAAVAIAVLGEVPDQDGALREIRKVLKPGARLVVGELFPPDPHMVRFKRLRQRAEEAGLRFDRRIGPGFGYFARFSA